MPQELLIYRPGGSSYVIAPSFLSYTFSPQSLSTGTLNANLNGMNFAVTGGSGTTGGTPVAEPTRSHATVTLPSPQTETYQACADFTGTWDDPNITDFMGNDFIWSLVQGSGNTVSGQVTGLFAAPSFSV